MRKIRLLCIALNTAIGIGVIGLSGCQQQAPSSAAQNPSAVAPVASNYIAPTMDQLYQMVAPIALFPDSLVAQVLAGSIYPDQVTAAETFLKGNPNLQANALQMAVAPMQWDPSVKGLTVFPGVLQQMAGNLQWTTSLGQAYANDPADVMNAIQVMRQRAEASGTLKSTSQQLVSAHAVSRVRSSNAGQDDYYANEMGGIGVPPPQQVITIAPSQPATVYVPQYDPATVYGAPVAYYPGYRWERPSYGDAVVAGVIGFGTGILVANLFEHHDRHDWGWNSWGMAWAPPPPPQGGGYGPRPGPSAWRGPGVVYNNDVYRPNVTNIRETINNNHTVTTINDNRIVEGGVGAAAAGAAVLAAHQMRTAAPAQLGASGAPQAMTMPSFGRNAGTAGMNAPSRAAMVATAQSRGYPMQQEAARQRLLAQSNASPQNVRPTNPVAMREVQMRNTQMASIERAHGAQSMPQQAMQNRQQMQHEARAAQMQPAAMQSSGSQVNRAAMQARVAQADVARQQQQQAQQQQVQKQQQQQQAQFRHEQVVAQQQQHAFQQRAQAAPQMNRVAHVAAEPSRAQHAAAPAQKRPAEERHHKEER